MKIIYEIDDKDEHYDHRDVELMTHKNKVMWALYEIGELYRIIYNRKFYEETDYHTTVDPLTNKSKEFVNIEYVENKLQNIFEEINFLIDY